MFGNINQSFILLLLLAKANNKVNNKLITLIYGLVMRFFGILLLCY